MIIVTGASGMIGKALVARLLASGHSVRALGRACPITEDAAAEWRMLPRFDAPEAEFQSALEGATHVVHCAAMNNDQPGATTRDFMDVNATLTARLAGAAASAIDGHFVFLSSIRAVAGPRWSGVIDSDTPASPTCDYGRSKLEGERGVLLAYDRANRGEARILRLPPVYGTGMKGNLAKMLVIADTPFPLPFAGIAARRSLISCDAAVRAIVTLLQNEGDGEQSYVASDRKPIALPAMFACLRQGLSRPRRLFSAPPAALAAGARLLGRGDIWENLTASQICDPSALEAEGWLADADSFQGLRDLARRSKSLRSDP